MGILIKPSSEIKMRTIKIRNKVSKEDEFELIQKIEGAAEHGEFNVYFVKNKMDDYPTISAEMVKSLKRAGYKIHLWDTRKGWDNLHRYYKGALEVTWYR